jgi:uncharacterized membrane protein
MGIGLLATTASGQSNPIVIENQQPGTSNWQISYNFTATDVGGQIKGYASATSVNKGENITFRVSVNPAQTYTIDIYRMGWYQGLGGRLMQHIGPLNGVMQPTCPTDATTGMIECKWASAYTLATQTSWTSGIYFAVLTNAQMYQNYIEFVVRDDSRVAALLYQQPVTTYQAYNDYPYDNTTGKSLYPFNSYGATTVSGGQNAVKVSFDRPYLYDGTGSGWGNDVFEWEISFIRWMEMSGYDVTYSTDVDTHINGGRLLNYRGILSVGHDEYWSKPMYDAFIAARDAGVNLGFFGANAIGWQVRFEPSSSGVPNRVLVCYRDVTLDPVTDPTQKTVMWRDPPLNRPEQTLVGVQYTARVPWNPQTGGYASYVVTNSGNWVYAGTGFRDGDSVPVVVGYEADRSFSNYPSPNAVSGTYTLLSNSPLGNGGSFDYANSSVYQAASGAWVFASGTMGWSWALDNFNGLNVVDPRIQQTTTNILNRLITPRGDFTIAASPSSRTVTQGGATSYSVTISPAGGFTGQVALSVSGLPSGANGSFTPNPATGSSTLSVTTTTSTPTGTYTLTITGVSGTLTRTTTVAFVVNAPVDFTLSASPLSQTVLQGGATSYSITISPTGGFSGQVTLSVSGQPSGANGSFTPNPATGSSTLSVTTTTSTPTGGYTLTITGVSGSLTHTTAVMLVVSPPDFTLSASPSSRTVLQGGAASYGITISPTGGFSGQVTLSVSGQPSGANGSFTPNPATGSSTLSVTTSASTPTGTYTLTITGVSGPLTHTTAVTLVVSALPDFTLSASPSSRTVTQGSATSYSVTISPTGGFSGQVTLSVSGQPSGANGSFTPNPATGSSTLSVTTSTSTPIGTYTLTITGVSGTLMHTATVALVVTGPGVVYDNKVNSGFQFGVTSVTTPALTIGSGANRAAMIMVAMGANNATNVTASLGGLMGTLVPGTDSGTTAAFRTLIFQVINPPSGSQTATVSWTTSMNVDVGVITVSGANQTTPCTNGTFTANNSNPNTTASVTITSNPGDLTASVGFTADAWASPFTNQTLKWGLDSGVAGGDIGPGTGTTTHTWTDQYLYQTQAVSGANFRAP